MKSFFQKFHIVTGILLCFILPVFQKLAPILIILWAVTFLFFGVNKSFFKNIFKNKNSVAALLFFIIHVVALLYTENMSSGVFDVESKLSFLIFPVIMSSSIYYYTERVVDNYLKAFVLGNILATLYCLYLAFYKWIFLDAPFQYFTYVDLSEIMHPTYFAMYLSFAILISIYLINKSGKKLPLYRGVLIFCIILFSVMIYLLSSKGGILTLFVLTLYFIFHFIKNKKLLILYLAGIVVAFLFFAITNSRVSHFTNKAVETLTLKLESDKAVVNNSTEKRIHIWRSGLSLAKENWLFGVSAGDLKYDLSDKYYATLEENNNEEIYFNAHNQYLETFIAVGVFGFLILIYWLIYPVFYNTLNNNRVLILGMFIILFINFIFESILNRQEGIVFTVFFWTLLTNSKKVSFNLKKSIS